MRKRFGKAILAIAAGLALGATAFAADAAHDPQIQAAVVHKLQAKNLSGVQASVEDGVVTLTGSVPALPKKMEAEKQAKKVEHVAGVRNLLTVAGASVPDAELRAKLARSLTYDRAEMGNVFNVLTVAVNNGVVTLGGEVRTPVDKESALSLVEHTQGVKGIVDNVKVSPLSAFDDSLRVRLLRAIYGDSAMLSYGIDPQAPIRIVVDNGHVGLYGTVDSQLDKQIAGMRANSAFGAFSVENNLQVAGQTEAR